MTLWHQYLVICKANDLTLCFHFLLQLYLKVTIPAVLILVAPIRIVWSARLAWLSVAASRVSFPSRTRSPVADRSATTMTIVRIRKTAPGDDVSTFAKRAFAESTLFANRGTAVPSVVVRPATLAIPLLAALQVIPVSWHCTCRGLKIKLFNILFVQINEFWPVPAAVTAASTVIHLVVTDRRSSLDPIASVVPLAAPLSRVLPSAHLVPHLAQLLDLLSLVAVQPLVMILAPISTADQMPTAYFEASGLFALAVLVMRVTLTLDVVAQSVSVSFKTLRWMTISKVQKLAGTENNECPTDKVCHNNRCINPCSTSCGVDSECTVRNHVTVCQCPKGFTGDPFVSCNPSSSSNLASRQSKMGKHAWKRRYFNVMIFKTLIWSWWRLLYPHSVRSQLQVSRREQPGRLLLPGWIYGQSHWGSYDMNRNKQ